MPKISVVIPSYNYACYLEDAVSSVLNQKYPNIEIIVVDDGSTDNTLDVLAKYSDSIKVISQNNLGLSSARNTGIRHASGDYIQFLDSDDLLGPESLMKRADYLESNPHVDIVVSRNKYFGDNKKSAQRLSCGLYWPLYRNNLSVHLAHFNIAPPHAFFMRKSVVDAVGFFDVALKSCEDYDYWLRVIAMGYCLQYLPGDFVYYRQHVGSMSKNISRQYYYDCILHGRVKRLLQGEGIFKSDQRCEVLLAFICGVVLTLSRYRDCDPEILESLFESVYWAAAELRSELDLNRPISVLSHLYLHRCHYIIDNSDLSYDAFGSILDLFGYVNNRRSSRSVFVKALCRGIISSDVGFLELYRLMKYYLNIYGRLSVK